MKKYTHKNPSLIIDDERFINEFKPKTNPFNSANGSWDGCAFETFGQELKYIAFLSQTKPKHVWTILDVDGYQPVVSGFYFINRFGFIVTEKPWIVDTEVEDWLEHCPACGDTILNGIAQHTCGGV